MLGESSNCAWEGVPNSAWEGVPNNAWERVPNWEKIPTVPGRGCPTGCLGEDPTVSGTEGSIVSGTEGPIVSWGKDPGKEKYCVPWGVTEYIL